MTRSALAAIVLMSLAVPMLAQQQRVAPPIPPGSLSAAAGRAAAEGNSAGGSSTRTEPVNTPSGAAGLGGSAGGTMRPAPGIPKLPRPPLGGIPD